MVLMLGLVVEVDPKEAKLPLETLRELIENRACDGINMMEGARVLKVAQNEVEDGSTHCDGNGVRS